MELLSRFSLTLEFDFNFIVIIYVCSIVYTRKVAWKNYIIANLFYK